MGGLRFRTGGAHGGLRLLARGLVFSLAAVPTCASAQALQTGPQSPVADISTGMLAAGTPLLTLDQERLYADSLFGKALEKASADAVAALVAENHQIEAELTAEEKALTEQRATMTAEAFRPLAEAFDAKVEQLRAQQEAKSKALSEARDAGRKTFINAVLPVLAEVMRQQGAVAILNKNAVILSFDSIDVTEKAIAAIDAKLGDGSALVPRQSAPASPDGQAGSASDSAPAPSP